MSEKKMYAWSDSEERYHSGTDKPATRAEAIAKAKAEYPEGFYFGVREAVKPEQYMPDADDILERIGENVYKAVGDVCEGWPSATQEQEDDLAKRLREVVAQWFDDTGNRPLFYRVVDVERIAGESNSRKAEGRSEKL